MIRGTEVTQNLQSQVKWREYCVVMAGVTNVCNKLCGLAVMERDDFSTDAAGDEIVFRCCERLPTLLMSKKWQEIGYTLTAVSEAHVEPLNR
jgi:hypothetical protein